MELPRGRRSVDLPEVWLVVYLGLQPIKTAGARPGHIFQPEEF